MFFYSLRFCFSYIEVRFASCTLSNKCPEFAQYVTAKGHYMQHDMLIKLLEMTSTSSDAKQHHWHKMSFFPTRVWSTYNWDIVVILVSNSSERIALLEFDKKSFSKILSRRSLSAWRYSYIINISYLNIMWATVTVTIQSSQSPSYVDHVYI